MFQWRARLRRQRRMLGLVIVLWLIDLAAAAPAEVADSWLASNIQHPAGPGKRTQVWNSTSSRTTATIQVSSSIRASITAKAKQRLTYGQDLPAGTSFNASVYSCWTGEPGCLLSVDRWSSCSLRWSSWSHTDVNGTSVPYTVSHESTSVFSYWAGWTSHWDPPGLGGGNFLYATGSPTSITTQVFSDTYIGTELLVYSTMKPPPNCTWTPWATIAKPNPATCTPCEVQGGTVELLYWADQATASLSSSWPHDPSYPVTAVHRNMTLTSPTVYIDFQTAYATNACGETVGGTHSGAIIGMLPQSLSSLDGANDVFQEIIDGGASTSTFYQAESFNFHNLAGIVPASVYAAQPSCFALGCYVIHSDGYSPRLMLPTEVRNLDPAWKTCGLDWQGLWDPPKALKPATVIDPLTTPIAASQTVPASPKSAPSSAVSQTATPDLVSTTAADPAVMQPNVPSQTSNGGPPSTEGSSHDLLPTASSIAQASATGSGEPQAEQQGADKLGSISSTAFYSNPYASNGTPFSDASAEVPGIPTTTTAPQPSFSIMSGDPIASAIVSGILAAGSSGDPQTPEAATSTATTAEAKSASSTLSPSNAYQVLSEALGTANPGAGLESSSVYASETQQSMSTDLASKSHASMAETAGTTQPYSDGVGTQSDRWSMTTMTASDTVFPNRPQSQATSHGSSEQTSASSIGEEGASTPLFAAILSVGSEILTAAPWHAAGSSTDAGLTMAGQTLTAGGRILTFDGHSFSAEETGLVYDGELLPFTELSSSSAPKSASTLGLSTGGMQLTAGPLSGDIYEVGGATLSPGGPGTVVNGHTISIGAGGALEVDGSTMSTQTSSSSTPAYDVAAVITLQSTTFTITSAQQSDVWLLGGSRISPGAAPFITKGHTFSVGSSGILEDGSWIPPTLIHQTMLSKVAATSSSVRLPVIAVASSSSTSTSGPASQPTTLTSTSVGAAPHPTLPWAGVFGGVLGCLAFLAG